MGTLRINAYPASVLFDSGASHSFISISFAHSHQIPFENMDSPLVVKTPGSCWQTKWVTPDVEISIGSIPFPFPLIALMSDGLDVILGMDWLVKYQANLDCAAKTVTVIHPSYRIVRYWSPSSAAPSTATPLSPEISLYFLEGITPPEMHEVGVVCDFPTSFLKNYLACHLIEVWSLSSTWFRELLRFPSGLTTCRRKN